MMLQNDTLQKFCLTDSEGQHKNNRNKGRKELPGRVSTGKLKGAPVEDVPEDNNPYNIY